MRDKLIAIIQEVQGCGRKAISETETIVVQNEALADYLIANGIGDVDRTKAEQESKNALKHFESHCHDAISGVFDEYINGISQGVDEKLNDYKNESERLRAKLYETEQQLITEKQRADVPLKLACEAFYCLVNDKEEVDEKTVNQLVDYFKEQAAERLKEKQ